MLDVHVLESVLVFVCDQLVVQGLFEIHSLNIKKNDSAVIIASEAHTVVRVPVFHVNVDLLMDHIGWCPHFGQKVQCNIFESEVTGDIKWGSSKLISLLKQL